MGVDGGTIWKPPANAAEIIFSNLKSNINNCDRKDVASYHNVYMEFSLAVMIFGSSHRPVKDPFCYRYQIDENSGIALIEDKAVHFSRRFRVAYLPDILKFQFTNYLNHLSNVSDYCNSRGFSKLSNNILKIVSGNRNQQIPLFFYIRSEKVEGVSEIDVRKMFETYSHVPANFNRRWVSTLLVDQKAPSWVISCALGHAESRVLPNGNYCQQSQVEIRDMLNRYINPKLLEIGCKPVVSQFRSQFGRDAGLPSYAQLNRELGPVFRRNNRLMKRRQAKTLIRKMAGEVDLVEWSGGFEIGSKGWIGYFIDQLNIKGLPVRYSLVLLSRYFSQNLNKNDTDKSLLWVRPERLEGSLWRSDDVYSYSRSVKVRKLFGEYLEGLGAKNRSLSAIEIMAVRVFSLAMYSAISCVDILEKVIFGDFTIIELNGLFGLYVCSKGKSQDYQVLPVDPVTVAISKKICGVECESLAGLRGGFLSVAKKLGVDCDGFDSALIDISGIARSLIKFEVGGSVREVESYARFHTSLDLKILTRIIYKKPLLPVFHKSDSLVTGVELQIGLSSVKNTVVGLRDLSRSLRDCMKDSAINKYLVEIERQNSFGNIRLSSAKKRVYLSTCMKLLLRSEQLPMVGRLVIHWGIWLCGNKTRHNNTILAETVVNYICLILNKIHQSSDSLVLYFDPDEWEDCYLQAINGCEISGMNNLVNRLFDFHYYLEGNWRVPKIEWEEIFSTADIKNRPVEVDANLLTLTEYQLAIRFLLRESKKHRVYVFCAWLIFLGFRFGLRWSESYYLFRRDFIYDHAGELYVRVRENGWRRVKSKSGNRVVPIIGLLSADEKSLVNKIELSSYSSSLSDNAERNLICIDPISYEKYDENRVSLIVNSVLKQVSGDTRLHYHHLRHGFATRLMILTSQHCFSSENFNIIEEHLLPPLQKGDLCLRNEFPMGVSAMRGVSDLLGHADMFVTLHTYIHIQNWLRLNTFQSFIPVLGDSSLAFLLGRSRSSIRKKRHRNGVSNDSQQLQNWLQNELSVNSSPPVKINKNLKIVIKDSILDSSIQNISLQAMHSLLVNYSSHGRDVSVISRRFKLDQDVVSKIISQAADVEAKSGYERFSLNKDLPHPKCVDFCNRSEWNNVDIALQRLSQVDSVLLVLCCKSWSSAYHHSTNQYFFKTYDDLYNFVYLLKEVGVSFDRASCFIQGHTRRNSYFEGQLSDFGIVLKNNKIPYKRLSKGKNIRQQSVVLDLRNISGTLVTKMQVNRFMFISSIMHG